MIQIKQVNKNDKDYLITKQQAPFFHNDIQEVKTEHIISEVIKCMNSDLVDADYLTSIDFNTDLTRDDISSIVPLQMLTSFNLAGKNASLLARMIKRHLVSLERKGRTEIKEMFKGEQERETDKNQNSIFGKVRGLLRSKKNENKE